MNAKILLKEIMDEVRSLPERRMLDIADFVRYLREKEIDERILNSPSLVRSVKKSRASWKNNKTKDFVSWDKIKNKI